MEPTTAATTNRVDLAADYNYRYDINATGNDSINYVPGYTRYFTDSTPYNVILYWDPQSPVTCNDTNDTYLPFYIGDGRMQDERRNHVQVGQYKLNITDPTWTAVDWSNRAHQSATNGFNALTQTDCQTGSTSTTTVTGRFGCTISTNHGTTGGNTYQDHDLTYHPYQFNIATNVKLGKDHVTPPLLKPFIYMADISKDADMSVQINTMITATGKNSTTALSNFVTGCYAKPLDINISKSNTQSTYLQYQYIFDDYNSSGEKELSTAEIKDFTPEGINRDINISTTNGYFPMDMGGTVNTTTRLNFNRKVNIPSNPENITFLKYAVQDSNNRLNADLNTSHIAKGYSDINKSTTQNLDITHLYGRTAAKETTIVCDTNVTTCSSGNPDIFIYYEVYCHKTTHGNICNPSLLPTNVSGSVQQKIDKRWYMSLDHNSTTYGDLNASEDILNNTYIVLPHGITPVNNYTVDPQHDYSITYGLPYTADMNDTVPRWLIYDELNASAISNSHTVIFRAQTEWSGAHEADSKTKTKRIQRVNRRTMW